MARTLGLVVAVLLVCGAAYAQPMDGTIVQWDWFDTSTPGFGPVTDMNINYRAIPATTQNPDLAWEYLKWYHTARTVKYEIMGSHRSPWVPFYESAEWVYSLDDYPHRATIPEFMQKTKFDPVKELSAWSGEVNHLISAAIRGELDPGNALEQAEQIVNAALSAR